MERCFCEYFYSANRSTAAGIKFPKSGDGLHLLDTGTPRDTGFRRTCFVKNSSDKSQGYFKEGKAGRCVCGVLT